jgi:hypothetical protein
MAGTVALQVCTCEFCGESYSPQGIETHQRYCDENPAWGFTPNQIREHFDDVEI